MPLIDLIVPDIGDLRDVRVIEILVKPGDLIRADQDLVTVESDKSALQIGAVAAGVLQELLVKVGDIVNQGSLLAKLEPSAQPSNQAAATPPPPLAETSAPAAAAAPSAAPAPAPSVDAQPVSALAGALPHASPSVRRFARELGVPLLQVAGSGPRGRITQQDVQQFVKRGLAAVDSSARAPGLDGSGLALAPWPKVDFASFGPVVRQPLARIQKLSGANLARNWVMIPHVTNQDEADITELEAFRRVTNEERASSGPKVTLLPFLIKAAVSALKEIPTFNASLDGDDLVLKEYFNIGFAVDTPKGLVVAVIRHADQKGVLEIAREAAQLAQLAREGKLTPAQMQGGTFTISSLGGLSGTSFTPIINAPEVAILGVSRATQKAAWNGREFTPRLTLPLSLSYDHRVIDGVTAARFNGHLTRVLSDFRRTTL